jgi:hypothetical protein
MGYGMKIIFFLQSIQYTILATRKFVYSSFMFIFPLYTSGWSDDFENEQYGLGWGLKSFF